MTSAETDSNRRLALKRKAEGDPPDSEGENTVMDSLVESWRGHNDPDVEIDLLICQQRDQYVASVHETGTDRPVCEEPKTPFPYDECGWDCIDDTSGKLLNNTLDEKARTASTRVVKTSPSTAVGWLCRSTNVKPTGLFLQPLHH